MLSEIPACRGTAWWTKYVLQTVCDYLRQVVPCSFQWSHQRVSHQQLQSLSHGKTLQVAMTLLDHVFSTGSEPIFLENAHKTFQLRIRIYTCHTAYTCTSTSECYTYRGDLHMLKVFLPQLKEAWPGRYHQTTTTQIMPCQVVHIWFCQAGREVYRSISWLAVTNFINKHSQPHCRPNRGLSHALPALSTMFDLHHAFLKFGQEICEPGVLDAIC